MLIDQANDDLQRIQQLHQRWLVGGDHSGLSLEQLPKDWQTLLEGEAADRQTLLTLAICAQQQTLLYESEVPSDLKSKPDLPRLNVALLNEELRPLFRRCLDAIKKHHTVSINHLLNLMLNRAVTAHPADWLPSANDDVPAAYWPWSQWVSNELSHYKDNEDEPLNADNWDEFFPAQRLAKLKQLRRHDSDAARELINQCAANEPADKRLKIIQILAQNLSASDVDFLQSITQDRSKKIAQLATQYLARLGIGPKHNESDAAQNPAQELAEWFEVKSSGFFKKRNVLIPRKLKSNKQQSIRSEQIQTISLVDFSTALGISTADLVSIWQFSENRAHDNYAFVTNAAETLSDDLIQLLLKNTIDHIDKNSSMLVYIKLLLPRLDHELCIQVMLQLMQNEQLKFGFSEALSFVDQPLSEMSMQMVRKSSIWKKLVPEIKHEISQGAYIDDSYIQSELFALGLLLPQNTADTAFKELVSLGILQADPILDSLKFNMQLTESK